MIRSEGNIAAENVKNAEEAEIISTCSNTKYLVTKAQVLPEEKANIIKVLFSMGLRL